MTAVIGIKKIVTTLMMDTCLSELELSWNISVFSAKSMENNCRSWLAFPLEPRKNLRNLSEGFVNEFEWGTKYIHLQPSWKYKLPFPCWNYLGGDIIIIQELIQNCVSWLQVQTRSLNVYQSCLLVLLLHPQTTIFDDESKKIQGGTSSFVLLALRPSDTVTGKKHLTDQGADEQGDSRSRIWY